ncbi:MAG: sensor histidine kinase [Candidatus Tectimicrobiota bacterium]
MPERHVFLVATVLLPVVLSLAQAHCGSTGLLFAAGCSALGSAAWCWQRRALRRATAQQLQTLRQELGTLQQQLAAQQRECQQLRLTQARTEQARDSWFVTVSQELRTPLNTVIGYSELFEESLGQLSGHDLGVDVHMLHTASQQLRRLLQDTRDLASLEAGTLPWCQETFDLLLLVEEVLADLQPLFQEREHTCELVLTSKPGTMNSDRPKVRRCLDNLLRHVALLSTQRSLMVQITCEATPTAECLVIHARASAPEQPAGHAASVAEQPEHPYEGTLQRYGGTGLGLILSQRLCHHMGGELGLSGAGQEDVLGFLRLPRLLLQPTSPMEPPDRAAAETGASEYGCPPVSPCPAALQAGAPTSVSPQTLS